MGRAPQGAFPFVQGEICLVARNATRIGHRRGRRIMVIPKLPKLEPWVRFPSPAPLFVAWRIPTLPYDAAQLIVQFAATVHLIKCVDRLLGRARSRWPHPSVIDPHLPITSDSFAVVSLDPCLYPR